MTTAAAVPTPVKAGPASQPALSATVFTLIVELGDAHPDVPLSPVGAGITAGAHLIATQPVRAGARMPRTAPFDPRLLQHGDVGLSPRRPGWASQFSQAGERARSSADRRASQSGPPLVGS